MIPSRRHSLRAASGLGVYAALVAVGLLPAGRASAQQFASAFQTKSIADTLKALGAGTPADSKDVIINSPDIAENGAVVPVGVRSNLPKTEMIALLVEKNPSALAGAYTLLEGAEPDVNMRIKMGQSSDVYAVVKADGKFYMTKKEIKVTLGGCGG
ncbi:MAG: thiosulfate oxidation carrier protein SoxY [Burkholderiaceae bacterium]|nr:thiosulfate oxidation carrier protein SoxY [Burkholderiaceae bacterium]